MAQQVRPGRRYLRAFVSGFFIAVPVSLTVFDRIACVARVEGASMQVRCGYEKADVKSLRHWSDEAEIETSSFPSWTMVLDLVTMTTNAAWPSV